MQAGELHPCTTYHLPVIKALDQLRRRHVQVPQVLAEGPTGAARVEQHVSVQLVDVYRHRMILSLHHFLHTAYVVDVAVGGQ